MIPLLVVVVASAMQRKDKDLLNYWGKPQSKDELMYPITVWWWPAFCGLWNRMWAAWNTDEKGPTEDTPCAHQTLQYLCTSSYFIHLLHTRPRHRGLNRLLLHGSQKVYGLLKLLALSTSTDCLTRQGQDWTLGRPGTCCLSTFRMRRHSVAKFWSSVFRFFPVISGPCALCWRKSATSFLGTLGRHGRAMDYGELPRLPSYGLRCCAVCGWWQQGKCQIPIQLSLRFCKTLAILNCHDSLGISGS